MAEERTAEKKGRTGSGRTGAWKLWLRRRAAWLAALALVLCVQTWFISQKEGYHMDELLSFELANAQFNPWIVPTQPQGRLAKLYENEIKGASFAETLKNLWRLGTDALQNRGESLIANYRADVYEEPVWISGEEFHRYITADREDAFQYLSVYFNVKDDNHPPLHFMALHTVSSFFRNRISPWMGCVLNLAAVLGCCVLLLKTGELAGRREAGLAAALLYGLSGGAVATVLLIRMYGLLTFWCAALFYLHIKKWKEQEWRSRNKALIAVTVLGFWTQYFFLFYCIALAATTGLLLLKRKKRRELYCYIRSMLIAAVIGIAGFPFAVSDVFLSGRGVEALGNLANGLRGYGTRLAAFGRILLNSVIGDQWGLGLTVLVLAFGAALLFGKKRKAHAVNGEAPFWCMLLIPAACYFLLAARMSPYLVDRYLMAVFPFAALAAAFLIEGAAGRKAAIAWALILAALHVSAYSGEYLYRGYEEQLQIAESETMKYGELPCICVYDGVGYYENLPEFACYSETLLLTERELRERRDKSSILDKERVQVLIKAEAVDAEEVLRVLEQEYGLQQDRILADGTGPHGDLIVQCVRKQ